MFACPQLTRCVGCNSKDRRQRRIQVAARAWIVVGYSYQERCMGSRQRTLAYLTTTKIGEKGQLTAPQQFLKDLGLGTGAPFATLRSGDGFVRLPEQQRAEHVCAHM